MMSSQVPDVLLFSTWNTLGSDEAVFDDAISTIERAARSTGNQDKI